MPGQNGPGSNGNKGVLHIPQNSSITGTSPSDYLVSYIQDAHWGSLTPLQRSSRCILQPQLTGGCPRGVMVKAMDCGIVVHEFVLQLCYYVHFRANTLGKGINPLILPAMG